MNSIQENFAQISIEASSACTRCGRCVEACPTAAEIGLDISDAPAIVEELAGISLNGVGGVSAASWIQSCNGSGQCSAACPESINVRQWVQAGRSRFQQVASLPGERTAKARDMYRRMSHAVRVLGSMQMPSPELNRILNSIDGRRKSGVLFYTGCNLLRTSHIIFNVMDILASIGVDADVVGGPGHCCGSFQLGAGDLDAYERIGGRNYQRFIDYGAQTVVTWCPTCTKNWSEVEEPRHPGELNSLHVAEFLAERLASIMPMLRQMPRRRAVLHEHQGIGRAMESVRLLMASIPNLEIVELPQDSGFSYACGGDSIPYPRRMSSIHDELLVGADQAAVDLVITTYHTCHRALAGAEAHYPFKVMNFTDVLSEALGLQTHVDFFKQYKKGGDLSEAFEQASVFLESNGVRIDAQTVDALTSEMFGETGIAAPADSFRTHLTRLIPIQAT